MEEVMLKFDKNGFLCEDAYDLNAEPKHAALFTTGNGYMGIRGSFEEFGSSRVQGAYIRGLIDEIVEVMEPFPDNEYMKKFYFDEQALKDFEKQDSCINFADPLLVRFTVGGETFYPWEGKILRWRRWLDTARAILVRETDWEDGKGRKTRFRFERFASYADEHLYVMRCTAQPLNHTEDITIVSGLDTKVRTGGQRIVSCEEKSIDGNGLYYRLKAGEKYGFRVGLAVHSSFFGGKVCPIAYEKDGILGSEVLFSEPSGEVGVTKLCWINISRDTDGDVGVPPQRLAAYSGKTFEELLAEHLAVWQPLFARFDIKIGGDHDADASLRFSNYHTVISAALHDHVHGLSAKTLSGERYNQFVWWDAEIYQLPVFRFAMPDVMKNSLLYRCGQLADARENAKERGFAGARFPFVASVGGREKVWKYARHPHLQVHITADIGYAVLAYYYNTLDVIFMREHGYELLADVLRYWVSRAQLCGNTYEFRNVTGTDEHHPYVNNDAYTNYLVKYVFDGALSLFEEDKESERFLSSNERRSMRDFSAKIYLPAESNGMIPQFDGYFSLSRTLKTAGGGTGKNFQMKQSGLYHESQIIKQPDVMLLYSYIDAPMSRDGYVENWDYYEAMCESSSSLSYPAHAICSADNGRMYSFYRYFMQTVRVDIDDIFHCAWQGIHGGCAAGGYFSILRGLCGVTVTADGLAMAPVHMPFWKKVDIPFVYRGICMRCELKGEYGTLFAAEPTEVTLYGKTVRIEGSRRFRIRHSCKNGRRAKD